MRNSGILLHASGTDTAGKAAEFGIVHDNTTFFGFLDWLQQNNIAKTLSEPNIMAVSGRPAQFNVGGEIPIVASMGRAVDISSGSATSCRKITGTAY